MRKARYCHTSSSTTQQESYTTSDLSHTGKHKHMQEGAKVYCHTSIQLVSRGSFIKSPITDVVKWEREELEPGAHVELVLKFHPSEKQKKEHKKQTTISSGGMSKNFKIQKWQWPYPFYGIHVLLLQCTVSDIPIPCPSLNPQPPSRLPLQKVQIAANVSGYQCKDSGMQAITALYAQT